MVVIDELEQGAGPKGGLNAITVAGNGLFSHMKPIQTSGATASFGGGSKMSFPSLGTCNVAARTRSDMDWQRGVFVGETIIGDYRDEVLSRIPEEIIRYVSARRGRTIVLRFRIKDDGVLPARDAQEMVVHPNGSPLGAFVFSMHGGNFPCENNPNRPHPNRAEGRLEDAPWYNPLWTRQSVKPRTRKVA
jgi:hypothetical protein